MADNYDPAAVKARHARLEGPNYEKPCSAKDCSADFPCDAYRGAEEVERLRAAVKSIATMLGWVNVPPRRTLEMDLAALKDRLEAAERRAAEAVEFARTHYDEYVRGVMHDRSIREEAAREERRACADIAAAFIEVERRRKLSSIAERIRASILCRDCAQPAQAEEQG